MNPVSASPYELIAEGIAVRGYACADGFLSPEKVAGILKEDAFSKGLLQFKKAGVGSKKEINESIRGDYIQWIDPTIASPGVREYIGKMKELADYLNRELYLGVRDFEVHSTIYPAGTYYKRHLDQFRSGDHRKLSAIFYLNENWEVSHGGQLRMYSPDGPLDFLPLAGRLICFRSDQLEHEVLPATRERMSLTGWMLDKITGLGHL